MVDKKAHKSAVKTSAAERSARRAYSGVKNEWGEAHSLRIGVQVGIMNGPCKGRQGAVVETPSDVSSVLRVLLDGEGEVMEFQKSDVVMLNDLTRVQSFIDTYGVASKPVSCVKRERSRDRVVSRSRRDERRDRDERHDRDESRSRRDERQDRDNSRSHRHERRDRDNSRDRHNDSHHHHSRHHHHH